MWNQWSAGPPPIPPPSTTCNPQPPLIGPVQPTEVVAAANVATPPVVAGASTVQPVYTAPSGAPSYTPAQYAAMTPEQQYAVQQHWQQWQAYEQQYAQWHAQYGEQYKREMAAIHSGPPPTVAQYGSISASNAYAYPPPAVSNPYQPPPAPVNAPPPPPPDDKTNSTGIKALPQIYEQPPPPPPPPQQDETTPNKSGVEAQTQDCQPEQKQSSQFSQNEENNWSQPPPPSSQNQGNRWNGPPTMFNQQERQQSNQFGQQNRQQQNQFGQQNRNQQNQFGQQDTQQNQFGQQDRQQQNQFGQQDRQQQNQFGQQNRQQQNQFGQQQDRQQQNQFGQQDRQQQNQFGQQDRQQQNQFGQQERNHQNQFNQQYNNQRGRQNQGRERQGIRQNNEDLSRNNNRFSNKFDNNTQQHFDGYDDRNNRQQQQWQPSDGPRQRNNENFSNNRFDNSYNNFNNMGQQNNQQGTGWNSSQKDNSFGVPEQQTQQQPQNFKSQSNAKPMNSSGDEKAFDEQFRLWEEQFENWKKENANHPDRAMYMKYEREFEKTRVRLLERREQMRRRKMLEMGQGSNQESTLKEPDESKDLQSQPPPQPQPQPQQHLPQEQPSSPPFLQSQHQQSQQTNKEPSLPNLEQEKSVVEKTNPNANVSQEKVCEASDMEQSDPEDDGPETSEKNIEPSKITLKENATEIINSTETNIFQKQEITELFKPTGGIPGLDLVGSKEIGSIENVEDERNNPEVIDLDKDGPTRPPKVCAPSKNNMLLFSSKVPEQAPVKILEDQGLKSQATLISSQPLKRKIPSLFDIVIEKPVLSPVNESKIASPVRNSSPVVDSRSRSISKDREALISPGQRPLSQVSATSNRQQQVQNTLDASTEQPIVSTSFNRQQSDLPPQAADLAKALQDPNVMQLLSHAIAQAQQAGVGNSSGNPQQNQLIQQLQKLRPLLQMTQNQNSNNQQWNNSQFPSQQSQNWQNQNSNNRFNMNDSNRNSFGRTPFNTNEEPLSRGFASGNDSDNSDRQQKNPRNPFRRNENRGNDNNFNNSSSEMNPDGPNAEGSFSNKNNNPFGRQLYSQPQHGNNFGRDNFDGSNLGGGNFNNRNMNVGDSYRGADFEENIANDFRGGNFGRENFQSNSFSEDNTDLGKGDFDRDNNYDGNSGGGGRFDTNRSNTNFGNSSGFRNNTNDTNNFRGGDTNDFYRPAQVFDYQNRSRSDAFIPQAKVVDYGHKPSLNMPVSSFSRDSSEFVPVKTIDYGHSSNSANKETPEAKTTKKVNRWNQEPQSNENEAHSTNIKQTQADKNQDSTKSIEEEGLSEEINEEIAKSTEEQLQYPNNKWVLQNPESRQRPGPPTKRGKRKPKTQPKHVPEEDKTECDEIEENFEEISENEDMNDSRQILSPSAKLKGKPLFPSVSDTNKNQPIVFPSMENNNTIPIDEILFQPGRLSRPKNIVIIIRGPPGSGKSHVAKLIKDKEVEMGGQTPRLLSIDDYFMVENDYEEKCSKTGRKIPKKEILYEYEKEAEPTYMQYLIKSFKKTVTDHLFDFIIVDCCNQSLRTFNEFYNAARDGNFSPFVIDLKCDLETCLNQNIHSRKEEEIKEIIKNYQDCPGHYIKLDVSNLLENVVEMEDVSDLEDNFVADSEVIELDDDDEEDEEQNDNVAGGFLKSKWDTDPTTENLARLDGTSKPISKRGTATIEEYLQIDGWEPPASNTDGKKRVRWADIEEKRAQDKMRAIGFVVGQTDWNRMMDPTSGSGALTKTKYIERYNKRR